MTGFLEEFSRLAAAILNEFGTVDPELRIEAHEVSAPELVAGTSCVTRFLEAVFVSPDGVLGMNREMEGVVETPCNLGVLFSDHEELTADYLLRSSLDTAIESLSADIRALASRLNADVEIDETYPV